MPHTEDGKGGRRPWLTLDRSLLGIAVAALVGAIAILMFRAEEGTPGGSGPEVAGVDTAVFLLISPDCDACDPEAPGARQLRSTLEALDRRGGGQTLKFIGVSVSTDVASGLDFLREFAPFDEVGAGLGWGNSVVRNLIWADTGSAPAIPQMVVIARRLDRREGRLLAGPDSLVSRQYGLDAINRWLNVRLQEGSEP